jgi:hypothetical protein
MKFSEERKVKSVEPIFEERRVKTDYHNGWHMSVLIKLHMIEDPISNNLISNFHSLKKKRISCVITN